MLNAQKEIFSRKLKFSNFGSDRKIPFFQQNEVCKFCCANKHFPKSMKKCDHTQDNSQTVTTKNTMCQLIQMTQSGSYNIECP